MVQRYDMGDAWAYLMQKRDDGEYVEYGDYEKLEAETERLKERIQAMYVGDLSPESRLNGYKVVTEKLTARRNALLVEIERLKEGIRLYIDFTHKEELTPISIMQEIEKWLDIKVIGEGMLISALRRTFEQALKGE